MEFTKEFIKEELADANKIFLRLKLQERYLGTKIAQGQHVQRYEGELRQITDSLKVQQDYLDYLTLIAD